MPRVKVWVWSVTTPFPSVVVRVLVSVEDPDSGSGIDVVDCVVVLVEDDVWATAMPAMRANTVVTVRTYRIMSFLLSYRHRVTAAPSR